MLICTRIDNSLPQPQERNLLQQNQFQTTDVESYTIYIPTMLLKRQCCSVRISGASGFLFCFDMQGIIYYHANLMHCLYNNQSSWPFISIKCPTTICHLAWNLIDMKNINGILLFSQYWKTKCMLLKVFIKLWEVA